MKKLLICGLLLATALLPAGELKIGWASCDLTTREPVTIPGQGYKRVSKGVIDEITATALVVDGGSDYVIFLSTDTLGTVHPLRTRILEELKGSGINPDKILSGATHTHTSFHYYTTPKTGEGKTVDDKQAVSAARKIAAMIRQAWETRTAGGVAYGFGYAAVGEQRRAVYFDDTSKRPGVSLGAKMQNGHAIMYGKSNDKMFSHQETGADPIANFLFTYDKNKQLTGAIVNIPCPSQSSENAWELSADYWTDVRRELRKKYGEKLFILPQCAAAGDVSPHLRRYQQAAARKYLLRYGKTLEEQRFRDEWERREIGRRVTACFADTLDYAGKEIFTSLPVATRKITMKLQRFRPGKEELKNCAEVMESIPEAKPGEREKITDPDKLKEFDLQIWHRNRAKTTLEMEQKYDPKDGRTSYSTICRIGNIAFAGNEFELYQDYMHRIQARSPFEQTFIVQLSWPTSGGYLGTERTRQNRGYGGVAASCSVSPEGGQQLVEATLKTLNELKSGKK